MVDFFGVCLKKKAIMLECVSFDLEQFGGSSTVSGLDSLLRELDKVTFKGFEHLVPYIADGIVSGMINLHKNGVAHRDLKPGNILISNAKSCAVKDDTRKNEVWTSNPCDVKLTDFGESWGRICQSSQTARTHTVNVFKGTLAFMPPEIIDPLKRPSIMNEEQMKKADIWSLGMVLFCLINPGSKVPFQQRSTQSK